MSKYTYLYIYVFLNLSKNQNLCDLKILKCSALFLPKILHILLSFSFHCPHLSFAFDILSDWPIISLILFQLSSLIHCTLAGFFSDCHGASLTLAINPNFELHFVPYLLLSFQSCFRGGFCTRVSVWGLLFAKLSLIIQCGIC